MKRFAQFYEPIKIYATSSKDSKNTKRAASGGVFFEFAKEIVKEDGVVFGSVLGKNGTCYHKSAKTIEQLIPMQGSKYVCSSIKKTYTECKSYLEQGYKVIFTATPCQINNLIIYLHNCNTEPEALQNLLTIDLFCYGTPPQKLFKLYIKWLEQKHRPDNGILNYQFRSKIRGWGPDIYHYEYYKNSKLYEESGYAHVDPYYHAFLESITLQEKCLKCPFSCKKRVGDISIGDFWGIENKHELFYKIHHIQGISGILVNTTKGLDYFKHIKDNFYVEESNYKEIMQCAINIKDTRIAKKQKLYIDIRDNLKIALEGNNYNLIFNKILHFH